MSSIIQIQPSLPPSRSELAHMAEHFFGSGRWDVPYWFIGEEAAMEDWNAQNSEACWAIAVFFG
jgi:hypothetical protein